MHIMRNGDVIWNVDNSLQIKRKHEPRVGLAIVFTMLDSVVMPRITGVEVEQVWPELVALAEMNPELVQVTDDLILNAGAITSVDYNPHLSEQPMKLRYPTSGTIEKYHFMTYEGDEAASIWNALKGLVKVPA